MTRKIRINAFEKLSHASYMELFMLWMTLNIACAFWYFTLAQIGSPSAPSQLALMEWHNQLYNSLYFSITTATSLGMGDIVPHGFSKAIVMVQTFIALLIFAAFVTKLVSRQTDLRLEAIEALLKKKK